MNKTNQLLCAHSAWAVIVLMSAGIFGIAGWFPPLSPELTGDDLARMFAEHRMQIRIGMTLTALSGAFWWTMSAAIAIQMRRIEMNRPVLTYVQMASASGSALIIMAAGYFWLVAAYRDNTSPEMIQMLSDFAWLTFVGFYPPGFIQNMSIGFCILNDKSGKNVYPRWVGFANIWIAILFLPGALLPFFHSGPFSWNGVIGFWLVGVAFFGWIIMMWWMTVKAIKNDPGND